jgi:hypothetical protein
MGVRRLRRRCLHALGVRVDRLPGHPHPARLLAEPGGERRGDRRRDGPDVGAALGQRTGTDHRQSDPSGDERLANAAPIFA